MTAPAVRHPGELRWETRLLAVVTATLVALGIATIYGAGVDAERPWIAMRLVEGCTLAQDSEAPALTRTGETAGTPAYLAPELVGGEHTRSDAQCDVYSLGVKGRMMTTSARIEARRRGQASGRSTR